MEEPLHNLNLKIFGSSIANDTERKVHFQSEAITALIETFPDYFENQCEKIKEKQSKLNEECIKNLDHDDIACNHELEKLQADCDFFINQQLIRKNIANHAIFLLVFAYFESIITHLRVSQGLPPVFGIKKSDVTEIMDKYGCKLPKVAEEALDYLASTVKELRNLLTHNYNGSTTSDDRYKRQLDIAEDEQKRGIGFAIDRGRYILKKEYLLYIQSKINIVLQAIYKEIIKTYPKQETY